MPETKRIYIFDVGGPHTFRTIYMDGRAASQGPRSELLRTFGRPLGRRIARRRHRRATTPSSGWTAKGTPHTEQLHLVERFTRTDFNSLKYEATVDDPGAYTGVVDRRVHPAMESRHGAVRVHLPGQQPLTAGNGRRRRVGVASAENRSMTRWFCAAVVMVVSFAIGVRAGRTSAGRHVVRRLGSDAQERHDVTVIMTWDGKTIGGTIDPGPDAVPFKTATLDSSTWTVHVEAERPAKGPTRGDPLRDRRQARQPRIVQSHAQRYVERRRYQRRFQADARLRSCIKTPIRGNVWRTQRIGSQDPDRTSFPLV